MKNSGPVHIGEAARRVLEKIKRNAGNLADTTPRRYDCIACHDTGIVKKGGRSGICNCQQTASESTEKERFFK